MTGPGLDRWLDYSGPLCDCPGETREVDDRWEPARPDAFDLAGLGGAA